MSLSIIIVNWNGGSLILDCLNSIYKNKPQIPFEIIVVDNNSSDMSNKIIKKNFPQVKLSQQTANVGFGKGNNIGVKQAKGENILFLNPDTKVDASTLDFLVHYLQKNPDVGILGCKVLYPNGLLQRSAYKNFPGLINHILEYNYLLRGLLLSRKPSFDRMTFPEKDFDKTLDAKHLMGSCLLVRKNEFKKIKGFDEKFFLYREETDLCLRYLKNGFKIRYIPNVTIRHHMGGTSGNVYTPASNYYMESTYRFFLKHRGRLYIILAWLLAVLSLLMNLVLLLLLKIFFINRFNRYNGSLWIEINNQMLKWHRNNFIQILI